MDKVCNSWRLHWRKTLRVCYPLRRSFSHHGDASGRHQQGRAGGGTVKPNPMSNKSPQAKGSRYVGEGCGEINIGGDVLRTGTVSTRLMVPGCHGYRLCVKMSAVTQQCVLDTRSSGVGTRFSGPIGASAGQFLCVHWKKNENFSCMKITVNLMVGIGIKKNGHVKVSFRTTREQALCLAVGKKQTVFLQQQALHSSWLGHWRT